VDCSAPNYVYERPAHRLPFVSHYYFGYFSNNFSALGAAERAAKNSTTGCELFAARARCGNLG